MNIFTTHRSRQSYGFIGIERLSGPAGFRDEVMLILVGSWSFDVKTWTPSREESGSSPDLCQERSIVIARHVSRDKTARIRLGRTRPCK